MIDGTAEEDRRDGSIEMLISNENHTGSGRCSTATTLMAGCIMLVDRA